MTEYQYLEALDLALLALSQAERQQLLDDYRRYFQEGRVAGKSDEDIARQLGTPQEAAKKYLAEREEYYRYPYQPKKPSSRRWLKSLGLVAAIGMTCGFAFYRARPQEVYVPTDYSVAYVERPVTLATPSSPDNEYFVKLLEKAGPMAESLATSIMGGIEQYTHDLYPVDIGGTFEAVSKIEVQGNYRMSVTVVADDREYVELEVIGEIPQAHDIEASFTDGKLEIEYNSHGILLDAYTDTPAHVTIYLPMGWTGEMDVITVSGYVDVSGNVSMSDLSIATTSGGVYIQHTETIDSLEIATASGEVDISNNGAISALSVATASGGVYVNQTGLMESLKIVTVSGEVDVTNNVAISSLSVSTASGEIYVSQMGSMDSMKIATASGDVTLEVAVPKLNVTGASGDINLTLHNVPEKATINSASGDVIVTMPDDCGYQVNTLSGDVFNDGDLRSGSDVHVTTVSGDVMFFPL